MIHQAFSPKCEDCRHYPKCKGSFHPQQPACEEFSERRNVLEEDTIQQIYPDTDW